MFRRDGLRKDLVKLDGAGAPPAAAVVYKDENCARQECGTNPSSNLNPAETPDSGPGWGMWILKQHEKCEAPQRRLQRQGSFVNLIGEKTVLTLRDEVEKVELNSVLSRTSSAVRCDKPPELNSVLSRTNSAGGRGDKPPELNSVLSRTNSASKGELNNMPPRTSSAGKDDKLVKVNSMLLRTSSAARGDKLLELNSLLSRTSLGNSDKLVSVTTQEELQSLNSRTTAAARVDDNLSDFKSLVDAPRNEEPRGTSEKLETRGSLKSVRSLSSTTTSSSSELKASGFRSCSSRHASSSSVGSSGESSIESYFDEEDEDQEGVSTSSNSVRRVAYKRGLSQRRIRGSSEHQHQHQQEFVSPEPRQGVEEPQVPIAKPSVETEEQVARAPKTKADELFTAVKTKDEAKVKALHSAGVSLECTDKNRMTPLIVACLDGNLLSTARTLISLGANVRGYRSGVHAGYPLHHAAKRGHEHVVGLLLSSGAEALAVNDDGQTALDMARVRGHASVVRVIEDWISLFKGVLRLITDNAGSQIMKRIWAVVLPSEANGSGFSRHELVLYNSRKVPMPESVILLGSVTSDFEEPDYTSSDPSLIITDRVTKTKFKFFSHEHGDKVQVCNFYKACKGISQERNKVPKPVVASVEESVQSRKSNVDRPAQATPRNGSAPAVPRSKSEKPGSRKNVIYPEESLHQKTTSR